MAEWRIPLDWAEAATGIPKMTPYNPLKCQLFFIQPARSDCISESGRMTMTGLGFRAVSSGGAVQS
jgi:hypothetical protein